MSSRFHTVDETYSILLPPTDAERQQPPAIPTIKRHNLRQLWRGFGESAEFLHRSGRFLPPWI